MNLAQLIHMNVRHFMTSEPVTVGVDDSIGDAASLMDEHSVGSVVALMNGKLAGILTDRDIAIAMGAHGVEASTDVSKVMTDNPARVTMDADIFQVLHSMRGAGLPNRIPVVNVEDELVGLVSIDDIAVVADNLNQEVFRNYTHTSTEKTQVPTGAKRIGQKIRNPQASDEQDPPSLEKAITVPHTKREHEQKST